MEGCDFSVDLWKEPVSDQMELLDMFSLDPDYALDAVNWSSSDRTWLYSAQAAFDDVDTPTQGLREAAAEKIKRFGRDRTEWDRVYDRYIEKLRGEMREDGWEEWQLPKRQNYGEVKGWTYGWEEVREGPRRERAGRVMNVHNTPPFY